MSPTSQPEGTCPHPEGAVLNLRGLVISPPEICRQHDMACPYTEETSPQPGECISIFLCLK